MPLGPGVRYRFRRSKGGQTQRLAFRGKKVIEVTPYKRGKQGKLVKAGKPRRV
jgi:hypothetical protein